MSDRSIESRRSGRNLFTAKRSGRSRKGKLENGKKTAARRESREIVYTRNFHLGAAAAAAAGAAAARRPRRFSTLPVAFLAAVLNPLTCAPTERDARLLRKNGGNGTLPTPASLLPDFNQAHLLNCP